MSLNVFLFEFKHFLRNKAKLFSYLFFMLISIYSIYNGYKIMYQQIDTIVQINNKQKFEILHLLEWFDNENKGPQDKPWINVEDPYWSIRYTPTYVIKTPSPLLPLGVGQSEQFGFYKKINRWSSTYDSDMTEELSNYERLINGNIDFSFVIIFLLPILIIILTFNINGLEKDLHFHKLISIQNKKINMWIINRLLFYLILLVLSVDILIFGTAILISGFSLALFKLVLISNLYLVFFFSIFYIINKSSKSSSSIAIKKISVWLLFCVIIPGSVHQYASFKYPVNYMTDFLDVNRKKTYDIFKLENSELYPMLLSTYPELIDSSNTSKTPLPNQKIRRSISAIVNQMNIDAANEIELQNENKNKLIKSYYFINPTSYIQNIWNSCTSTDYYSYKDFRFTIQESVDMRNKLIVFEMWNDQKVDKKVYEQYLKMLK